MSKRPGDPGYSAGWCIHYRGITGPRGEIVTSCEAGVEYATFRNAEGKRLAAQQPCFLDDHGRSKPGALHCEHLRRPTPEEIAAHEQWLAGRIEKLGKAMLGIASWRAKHKGRSHSEVVECPVCQGRLHLSIAASNGHVHGRCGTAGCVAWVE